MSDGAREGALGHALEVCPRRGDDLNGLASLTEYSLPPSTRSPLSRSTDGVRGPPPTLQDAWRVQGVEPQLPSSITRTLPKRTTTRSAASIGIAAFAGTGRFGVLFADRAVSQCAGTESSASSPTKRGGPLQKRQTIRRLLPRISPSSRAVRWAGQPAFAQFSRVSRIFRTSASGENGFARKLASASTTPRSLTMSAG